MSESVVWVHISLINKIVPQFIANSSGICVVENVFIFI